MQNLIESYIKHLQKRKCSPETVQHYEQFLRRFYTHIEAIQTIALSASSVTRITAPVLESAFEDFAESAKLSIGSRNNYVAILKGFFSFLLSQKILAENPASTLYQIKDRYNDEPPAEDESFYSEEQIKELYHRLLGLNTKTSRRDLALVALMLGTGMRISEACSLNVQHAKQMLSNVIRCRRKGGKWQKIAVAPFVAEHVAQYLQSRLNCHDDDPLFLSSHGRRLSRQAAWKSLAKKQKAVGLQTGTHILRHTVLTALEVVGGMTIAGEAADHRSSATTEKYTHRKEIRVGAALKEVSYGSLFQSE